MQQPALLEFHPKPFQQGKRLLVIRVRSSPNGAEIFLAEPKRQCCGGGLGCQPPPPPIGMQAVQELRRHSRFILAETGEADQLLACCIADTPRTKAVNFPFYHAAADHVGSAFRGDGNVIRQVAAHLGVRSKLLQRGDVGFGVGAQQ